jgi:hypothetical protein
LQASVPESNEWKGSGNRDRFPVSEYLKNRGFLKARRGGERVRFS